MIAVGLAAGLFVDGVPESIALGLTIAEGEIGVAEKIYDVARMHSQLARLQPTGLS